MVITGKATTPEDATVVDGNQSEKNNISDAGFSSRPTLQRQFFTKDDTSLELKESPAGGYAPRVYGYINLSDPGVVGIFSEQELEVGYARRRIYPSGQNPSWTRDEYSLDGKVLTILFPQGGPTFFNYTGWYNAATGCTRYFQVLYKYNSRYDPN